MQTTKAQFVEPMLLLAAKELPEGEHWVYQPKLDGYRALAIHSENGVQLRSRYNKDLGRRYPYVVKALSPLPGETVIDGELVALDEFGRPSFNALQNHRSLDVPVYYYVFDVLMLNGQTVLSEPLVRRTELLRQCLLPLLHDPIRECPDLNASLADVIQAVRTQGLEGVVAKNLNSFYESGRRSGSWLKMRLNQSQEFVIGGYTVGRVEFDSLIFGHYFNGKLHYVGRTRSGFTPLLRTQLKKRFRELLVSECPFANLPEAKPGRWGLGLTADKLKDCRWLKPLLVGRFEFVEWTPDHHLRHSKFIALRDDLDPRDVRREHPKDEI